MPKFNTRGFVSLVLSFSFLVVFVTGLVLWLAHSPQTFGIGKGVWKHSHIFASLLMVVAAFWHFALNLSAYWSYLWKRASGGLHHKRELALALVVTVAVVGTAAIDDHGASRQQLDQAMTVQQIAKMSGQSTEKITAVLKKEGIDVRNPVDSLSKIAEYNKKSPQDVVKVVSGQLRGGPAGH